MDKEQARRQYLQNIYCIEYYIKESELMSILTELQHLRIVDDLDIDVDYFRSLLSAVKNEMKEKSNSDTFDYYRGHIESLGALIKKICEKYNPLVIVDLYFQKIHQLTTDKEVELDEIKETIERLVDYVEDLKLSKETEYQKICEKYGVIEYKALIELIAVSEEHGMKK